MNIENTEFLTIAETCKELKSGRTRVYQFLNDGLLQGAKLGNKTVIYRASIDKFRKSLPAYK